MRNQNEYSYSKMQNLLTLGEVFVGMELLFTSNKFRLPTKGIVSFIHYPSQNRKDKTEIIIGIETEYSTSIYEGKLTSKFISHFNSNFVFRNMEDFNLNAHIQANLKSLKEVKSINRHINKLRAEMCFLLRKIEARRQLNKTTEAQQEMLDKCNEKYLILVESVKE